MSEKNHKRLQKPATAVKTSKQKKARFSTNLKLSLLLGLISFIVYANTIQNGYALDDQNVIKDNRLVKSGITAIPKILTTPYRFGWVHLDNDLYRPLSVATFAIEYQLFGIDPAPEHFVNTLIFAGCVILLFLFFDNLFLRKKTAVAFIAALVFAVHPIHTEVVANIKSRDELLCFFFAFLSLNIFIKYMQSGKIPQLFLGMFCFLLALLSKEAVITFLIAIPLIFFFYRNENKKRSTYITLSGVLTIIFYLSVRFLILNHYHTNQMENIGVMENALANPDISYGSRIATAILILGYYIKLLIVPYPLICDYSYNSIPYAHFSDPGVLIALAVYIFLIVFSCYRLFRNKKDPYAFGIIFFLVSMSLFSNIIFLIGFTMAERFTFFASAGFCLLIALLIEQWVWKKEENNLATLKTMKTLVIIIPICLCYSFITINRNKDWASSYTLYKADLGKAPNDSRLYYYIGDELITNMQQEHDMAERRQIANDIIDYLQKAIAIYPGYEKAHFDMGIVFLDLSLPDSAEVHYLNVLRLNPKNVSAIYQLARINFVLKKYQKAIEYYRKTLDFNPGSPFTYGNIGLSYANLGKFDSAIFYADKAMAINPNFPGSYEILASSYKGLGQNDSASKYEDILRQIRR